MHSDEGARYHGVIELDCGELVPWVARPGDPGNGLPLDQLAERARIDIA